MIELSTNCLTDIRTRIRGLYLQTIASINTLTPDFIVNEANVNELDRWLEQGNGAHNNEMRTSWPIHLNPVYNLKEMLWCNVAIYKDTQVGLYIDQNRTWIKFPTITSRGNKLNTRHLRHWKWGARRQGYDSYSRPEAFEIRAHGLNRLPNIEELYLADSVKGYGSWIQNHTKHELNSVTLDIQHTELIAKQIEDAYIKYENNSRKSATFAETSRQSVYKMYLKYRGNQLLERYKQAHPIQTKI